MFGVAKHTVCMGNGMQQLKDRAEFITDSVLSDGIEKALQHYDLL
jgi:hydroxymethylpyrimidine pyrophosphatase-like HAD family hydrolase